MDEIPNSLQPESEIQSVDPSEESTQRFMRGAARRARDLVAAGATKAKENAVPVFAAGTIAAGTITAVALKRSHGPEVQANVPHQKHIPKVKADVLYRKYGTSGNPEPAAIFYPDSPNKVIEGFKPFHSTNPYEIAQQFLWLLGHNKIQNRYWNGALTLPAGTTLYHAPLSSHFMPGDPTNDGKADKLVVPEGEVLLIQRPRMFVSTSTEPPWALVTLDNDKAGKNRATDITQVYWLNLEQALQNPETKYFAYPGSTPEVLDGGVDANGNPTIDQIDVPVAERARMSIVPAGDFSREQTELGLQPTEDLPSY